MNDPSSYRPFERIIETLASLYDVQKQRPDELTYRTRPPVIRSLCHF